tara:strand:- start:172 stop:678 length:507 start_codon:yes stop_codon:yes gene_type:complete
MTTDKKDERYDYIVYKLCSDNCDDSYIGSTRNITQRKKNHKSVCNNKNNKGYNQKTYRTIRDNGGWENWRMVPLELMKNSTKLEAEMNEEFHRVQLKAKLNSMKASCGGLTEQEYQKLYRQDNKEQINEQKKQKFDCDCGGKYIYGNKSRHEKTIIHQNYVDIIHQNY